MWERACRPLSVGVVRTRGRLTFMMHVCHRGLHDCTICPDMWRLAWNGDRVPTPANPEHKSYWDHRLKAIVPRYSDV